jgi:hypothetical protein
MNRQSSTRRFTPQPHPASSAIEPPPTIGRQQRRSSQGGTRHQRNARTTQRRSQQTRNDFGRSGVGPTHNAPPPRHAIPSHPQRRQPSPIERIEDPVPLRDVQIGLLHRHAPKPSIQQSRRNPLNPRKPLHPGPMRQQRNGDFRSQYSAVSPRRDSGVRWSVLYFFASRSTASRPRPADKVKREPPPESRHNYRHPNGRPHFRQVHVFQD